LGVEKINIDRFLELAERFPVLDVRSPSEFRQAHIPGAFSLPLFSDEERKVVGTAYKQQSREAAIKLGLDFYGPKMRGMVEEVEKIVRSRTLEQPPASPKESLRTNLQPSTNTVLVHCWRGGMRSAGVAWLLDLYGFKVYTLAGGYKAFRNWVLKQFTLQYRFNILGGYTGSGKTEVLRELENRQELVIDLESLAGHKGSAFGNIGLPPQPSQEMFENRVSWNLRLVGKKAAMQQQPIWLEDESQRIGTVNIPQPLWNNMRSSPLYFIDIPFEERLQHLVPEYGCLDKEKIAEAILRVQKRLGGLETKTALGYLEENNMQECFRILLKYYDKYYNKGLNNRDNLQALLTSIPCSNVYAARNAAEVLKSAQSISA
jgi:tRNA 2-selenouridine synthase